MNTTVKCIRIRLLRNLGTIDKILHRAGALELCRAQKNNELKAYRVALRMELSESCAEGDVSSRGKTMYNATICWQ